PCPACWSFNATPRGPSCSHSHRLLPVFVGFSTRRFAPQMLLTHLSLLRFSKLSGLALWRTAVLVFTCFHTLSDRCPIHRARNPPQAPVTCRLFLLLFESNIP